MVLEIATFQVKDGHAELFAAAYLTARDFIAQTPGCRSVRLTQGVEKPDQFVLLVEWDTLEAHLETFRTSDRFPQWRAAIGPHFDTAQVEHVRDL